MTLRKAITVSLRRCANREHEDRSEKTERQVEGKLTVGLVAKTLANLALVLEVNVPLVGLAGSVLEDKGKDGLALLDGVLAVGVAAGKSAVDRVESSGGGELVYSLHVQRSATAVRGTHWKHCAGRSGCEIKNLPFLRDIVMDFWGVNEVSEVWIKSANDGIKE